ncbi:hypothetical protein FE257_003168 [Aspergillus nanangensis]|uniref:Uncharacterized protein n=1 Tax=Aspergillus nanangensis TaxID=2582783 RepID=A0AAD4CBT3_ASPNN|nr:hypothetical protein FE257_003168 [Aspergillus nanangensis]
MSRNWFPALMAIGMGVFSGYYAFQPALKELQTEKDQSHRVQPPAPQAQQTSTSTGSSEHVTETNSKEGQQ